MRYPHTPSSLALAAMALAATPSNAATDAAATYFGSIFNDTPYAVLVHPLNGDVYVIGTQQGEIPATAGAWITTRQAVACGTFATPTVCVGMLARFTPDLSTLVAATYLPGNSSAIGQWTGLAVDPVSGDLYLAGSGAPFTGTTGAYQPATGGGQLVRLRADLSGPPLAATNYGGFNEHFFSGVAVHPLNGDVYATGHTLVGTLPGVGAGSAQSTYGGGANDRFVLRFSPALDALVAATFVGGSGAEWGESDMLARPGLALDPVSGDVVVVGGTSSTDFPTTVEAVQPTPPGTGNNGFVVRLDADLGARLAATYLGGDGVWAAFGAAFDPADGALFVAGMAFGAGLPGAAAGAQPAPVGGGIAGFVAQLSPSLDSAVHASYYSALSGGVQRLHNLIVEPGSGDLLVVGHGAGVLPAEGGALVPSPAVSGNFFARFSPDLASIRQSSWTGPATGLPHALAIDPDGRTVYTSFDHSGTGYGFTAGAAFPTNPGSSSALVFAMRSELTTDLFANGFEAQQE